jgi:hypothetical protein
MGWKHWVTAWESVHQTSNFAASVLLDWNLKMPFNVRFRERYIQEREGQGYCWTGQLIFQIHLQNMYAKIFMLKIYAKTLQWRISKVIHIFTIVSSNFQNKGISCKHMHTYEIQISSRDNIPPSWNWDKSIFHFRAYGPWKSKFSARFLLIPRR